MNLRDLRQLLEQGQSNHSRRLDPVVHRAARDLIAPVPSTGDAIQQLLEAMASKTDRPGEQAAVHRALRIAGGLITSVNEADVEVAKRRTPEALKEQRERTAERLVAAVRAEHPEPLTVAQWSELCSGIVGAVAALDVLYYVLREAMLSVVTATATADMRASRSEQLEMESPGCEHHDCDAPARYLVETCDGEKRACALHAIRLQTHMQEAHGEKVELVEIH